MDCTGLHYSLHITKKTGFQLYLKTRFSLYNQLVGARGFEPPTTCTPCRYATRLRYAPNLRSITDGPRLPVTESNKSLPQEIDNAFELCAQRGEISTRLN